MKKYDKEKVRAYKRRNSQRIRGIAYYMSYPVSYFVIPDSLTVRFECKVESKDYFFIGISDVFPKHLRPYVAKAIFFNFIFHEEFDVTRSKNFDKELFKTLDENNKSLYKQTIVSFLEKFLLEKDNKEAFGLSNHEWRLLRHTVISYSKQLNHNRNEKIKY